MNDIRIIDYKKEHQPYFEKLNKDWISENFELEPLDVYVLQNPEEAILNKGGAILVALCDKEVAGVLALKKVNATTFEYTKMAVDPAFRRRGIGEALSYASFAKAKELGATELILYSNTLQAAAIRLYEKLGFHHLEVEKGVYERANVKMKLDLMQSSVSNPQSEKFFN